ncbi:MAG: Y-family DNA polymerase [Planctomycetota bacterium]|nr:Y-family DNA polymerase [Planctomycetota bacterium]
MSLPTAFTGSTKPRVFALADCNNFYASCERVFNPALRARPVVVLSNNDGCVVSRSNEAKAAGIGMGVPVYQVRSLIAKHKAAVFSSNYALYGDLSRRVMQVLARFTPSLEIYSIDEAFLSLDGIREPGAHAAELRATVGRWTGIPVSVGIGPSKALAKLAARAAKQAPMGVFACPDEPAGRDALLESTALQDVWGIGPGFARRLERGGIRNALDFARADARWIKRALGVVGLRLALELRGETCLALEEVPPAKREIATSRSLAYPTADKGELEQALAAYVSRAAEKLRGQHATAGALWIFLHTDQYRNEPQHYGSRMAVLPVPTDDTAELMAVALELFRATYRPGHRYRKAGAILTDLRHGSVQGSLFDARDREKSRRLMAALDAANRAWGTGTVRYAAEGFEKPWRTLCNSRSQRYTTRWDELLSVAT